MSELFDGMMKEAVAQSSISDFPLVWVCPRLQSWDPSAPITTDTPDGIVGRLLMWAPPAYEPDSRSVEHGTFFEVQVVACRKLLLCFQLLDHGRTAQRCLVFASDSRYALSNLACTPSLTPCRRTLADSRCVTWPLTSWTGATLGSPTRRTQRGRCLARCMMAPPRTPTATTVAG